MESRPLSVLLLSASQDSTAASSALVVPTCQVNLWPMAVEGFAAEARPASQAAIRPFCRPKAAPLRTRDKDTSRVSVHHQMSTALDLPPLPRRRVILNSTPWEFTPRVLMMAKPHPR